jgi:hypothetical protein
VDARECWHGMHIGVVERDENGEPTYVCPRCDRRMPWSNGATDDTPALCDECAMVVQSGEWEDAAGVSNAKNLSPGRDGTREK